MTLGQGTYQAFITERGGGQVRHRLPISSANTSKTVDASGTGSINVPVSADAPKDIRAIIADIRPWRDELRILRNRDVAHVGPVTDLSCDANSAAISSNDLFYWSEVRFLDKDVKLFDDAAKGFKTLFELAMAPDPSPNVNIVVHETGQQIVRAYKKSDYHRVADLLRELARTDVDFITIDRTLYVGGKEVFAPETSPATPLILTDQGVASTTVKRNGSQYATDIAVFAGSSDQEGKTRNVPLVGRAQRADELMGLVQRSFTELLIKDLDSANANAHARLEASQPAPLSVSVTFSPYADFTYREAIPGRRVDTRLSQVTPLEVMEVMRLSQLSTSWQAESGETISGELVPLGLVADS